MLADQRVVRSHLGEGRDLGPVDVGDVGMYVGRNRPLRHALIGGAVGLVISLADALVTWNKGPAFGPHWYPLALIVLALPQAWLGGILQRKTDTFKVTTPTR